MSNTACGFGVCAFDRVCVLGDGPLPADLMFIGEAPGKDELRQGRPFVGRAGQLLDAIFDECHVRRTTVRITNTCGCVDLERDDRRPLPAELDACRPRLDLEIEWCQPRVVILMGNTATSLFFPGERIGQVYNMVRSTPHGYLVVPTYHPAHALRGAPVREIIVDAVKLATRLIAS